MNKAPKHLRYFNTLFGHPAPVAHSFIHKKKYAPEYRRRDVAVLRTNINIVIAVWTETQTIYELGILDQKFLYK